MNGQGAALGRVITALESTGHPIRQTGNNYRTACPGHDGSNPTCLSVTDFDGLVKIHCFAGCETQVVLDALGLSKSDLYDNPRGVAYDYRRLDGSLERTVRRWWSNALGRKQFSQDGPKDAPILWRLPKIVEAVEQGTPVYLCEGEQCVIAFEKLGAVATTAPMGAGSFALVDVSPLKGAHVIASPDQDKQGEGWLRDVLASLDGVAEDVTQVAPKVGNDVADHVAAGYGLADLVAIDEQADAALEARLKFNGDVSEAAHRLRVRDAAGRLVQAERLGVQPPPDAGTLAELLARPASPRWRVEGLLPAKGRLLIAAQRKCGKTTLAGNLFRALLTGAPFLDRFQVARLDGCVVALNYELPTEQYARWMSDIGVPQNGLYVVNLRGRRNLLADEAGRAELVEMLRANEAEVLAVDPFGRGFTGKSQNDVSEVSPWLCNLDQVAELGGASELILTAHAGWDGERTRGSSGLEDWPDAILTMTRDPDTGQRFLKAQGRDVDLDEDRLDFDPGGRRLSLSGDGSRKQLHATEHMERLVAAVVDVVIAAPGINVANIRKALREADERLQQNDANEAARLAVERGLVRREAGPGNSKIHFPTPESYSYRAVPEPYRVRLGSSTAASIEAVLLPPLPQGSGTGGTADEPTSPTRPVGATVGPCVSCSAQTVRYGDDGAPLCPDCTRRRAVS